MRAKTTNTRARVKRTLRAVSGQRILIENFQRGSVSLIGISDGDRWLAAWLPPAQLRRLIEAGRRILK